mgnify:CR=1 FL=1
MNLIKNIKIDKSKIIELSIVLTTLFLITSFLYIKFITGKYIFASGDYLAPKMISESIKNLQNIYGEYPYWLPSIFGGMPTIHSLQNISSYYMPNFILNILKIFSAPEIWYQLIHLIFAGLGIYVLLRFLKIDFLVALFGGVLFLMTPYMNVCIVHGHGSQIMTAAYIPWICWGLLSLWQKPNLEYLGILAILIGFQLQRGHIQIAYYTWLMIGLFILYKLATSKFIPKFYYYLTACLCFGFLMSLSIIWPSYLYSEHSIRGAVQGGAAFDYATGWSFSINEMITFVLPSFYGFGGNTYWGTIEPAMTDFPNYLGVITIIFILYGIIKSSKNNTYLYFLILSIFFLLLSFGKNFFLFELLFNYLPFFNKFRVPMMALMMFHFSIIILSALGLQLFINNYNNKRELKLLSFISAFLLVLFLLLKFFSIPSINISENISVIVKNMINNDLNSLMAMLIIIISFIVLLLYNTIKYQVFILLIISLSIFDMYRVNQKIIANSSFQLESNSINQILSPLNRLKKITENKKEQFRIISFTGYNQIRNWAGYANLEDITGYHPAKLKNYAQFEPYLNTNIGRNLFRLLNVKKIINWNGDWEILSAEENLNPLNRIFFVDNLKQYNKDEELLYVMNSEEFDPKKMSYTKSSVPIFKKSSSNSNARIKKWTPNKIVIETNTEEDNFIGLSEIYYPNWEITSHNIKIIEINGLLRGFVAPKGKHKIIMEFNYNDIKYSSFISFITFIIMLLFLLSTSLSTFLNEKTKKSL